MWYLVGLVWIALVAGIFWVYKNKKAKRDAAREQQFKQMFSELARGRGVAAATSPVAAPTTAPFSKKSRLLAPQTTLLYYLLRSGLPDHEIFVDIPFSGLLEAPPQDYEAAQKMKRLALARADFVVCNKQMEIIAAVLVDGGTTAGEAKLIEECLRSTSLRAVRIDPAKPPKHSQVRTLVYGES